ncbi:type II toxin-antitoxin system death-on-curing family toxin [Candidatus Palauibacter sp.]|uniref:type II toxin-antitoxin system death-on-curing family toxin n=1 Tax=Candidatus Palauibacter sp. TaxID=3101350 RepID=UPI003AF22810
MPAPRTRSRHRRVRRPPPSFGQLGRHSRNIQWLSVGSVLAIHNALVSDFAQSGDPIAPPGVRDQNLIESAVFRPQTGFREILKYPTIETSAAALLCALIQDHPFHNGNKRTALVAMLAFLDKNDLVLTCKADELFQFVLLIAQHRVTGDDHHSGADNETLAVAEKICGWSRVVSRVEVAPSITFRKLRTILERRDCRIKIRGSRAHIDRKIAAASRSSSRRQLRTKIHYRDDGTDVPVEQVRQVRTDLHLNPEDGHDDSDFFHSRQPTPIDAFIAKYRKILVRLGRL